MSIINIRKTYKNKLLDYSDGSYDEIINELIDDVGEDMPMISNIDAPVTTMRIKESTLNRLDVFRITPYESYESIIVRLLLLTDMFK